MRTWKKCILLICSNVSIYIWKFIYFIFLLYIRVCLQKYSVSLYGLLNFKNPNSKNITNYNRYILFPLICILNLFYKITSSKKDPISEKSHFDNLGLAFPLIYYSVTERQDYLEIRIRAGTNVTRKAQKWAPIG